jgi:hypothetical protein
LFSAPFLLLLIFCKKKDEWRAVPSWYRIALILCCVAAFISAVWEVFEPRDHKQLMAASLNLAILHDVQLWCALTSGFLVALLCVVRQSWLRWILMIVGIIIWSRLIFDKTHVLPELHHGTRAYVSAALPCLGFLIWRLRAKLVQPMSAPVQDRLISAMLAFVVFATVSVYDMDQSLAYRTYLDVFRQTLNSRGGLVSFEISGLPFAPYNYRFCWLSTLELMSVLLRESPDGAIINYPKDYTGFKAYDIANPRFDIEHAYP